ncbi:helix-turn-helix domain-containing protein [Mycolicibacterium frederiksbergense]|uniref:helix-turn-helix domain-containing protein n=1 Tax=Mycolicibacterium frederiksbergense TaxID=117567 RepID=UPI00265C5E2C|nr:helix-turn-helix transcriptional regulator [Mycolicibacterium frederiksbergense]MDO0973794.1 helix-turn-helix transcriptional regulator [Mycolicibacterium frederiksbergense]
MADDNPETAKALTKNPLGPSGKAVAANVERLRNAQNLTFAALSERLERLDRPIPTLGLRKIVAETRRVDADDLVGLAAALGVSPVTLLMPPSTTGQDEVAVTGVDYPISASALWKWLRADYPMQGDDRIRWVFFAAAWPEWRLHEHVEEREKAVTEVLASEQNLAEAGWLDESDVTDGND